MRFNVNTCEEAASLSPSRTVLRNRYLVKSVACILSKCHLWRKTEDGDLIVKVWVLEVRLHVGIVEASLGCQHHAISRLGCLSFQLKAFCFEGNFLIFF